MITPLQKYSSVSYEQACNPNTLRDAWRLVRKGGPAPGVDGQTLDEFAAVAQRQFAQIEGELRGRRYRFLPVRRHLCRQNHGRQATARHSRHPRPRRRAGHAAGVGAHRFQRLRSRIFCLLLAARRPPGNRSTATTTPRGPCLDLGIRRPGFLRHGSPSRALGPAPGIGRR